MREVFEKALHDDPDDLATHSAFADWLMEQNDPRGEFIRVQLALEDERLPARERKKLQTREKQLLTKHEREWLGELAPFLLEEKAPAWRKKQNLFNSWRWRRGWVEELRLWSLELPLSRVLARAPATRFLRRLQIDESGLDDEYEPQEGDGIPRNCEYPNLYPLARAPFLPHLRFIQLGHTVDFEESTYNSRFVYANGLDTLVARATRLEELFVFADGANLKALFAAPSLTSLRTLLVYHHSGRHPLKALADNPALGRLETIWFHPAHGYEDTGSFLPFAQVRALLRSPNLSSLSRLHLRGSDLGDRGCREIVKSGILKRLKLLDLRHGCITDEGARTLVNCPDVKNLEVLDLEYNVLTDEGMDLVETLPITVHCGEQYEDPLEYLYSGDME